MNVRWVKCEDELPPKDGSYVVIKSAGWKALIQYITQNSKTKKGIWMVYGDTEYYIDDMVDDDDLKGCEWLKGVEW